MKLLKNLKKTMLVISAAYITIGVLLILNKKEGYDNILLILSASLGIAGLMSMIKYFVINVKLRFKRNDFIIGAVLISVASLIFIGKQDMLYLIEKILGISMVISGFFKLQDMLDTKAAGESAIGLYLFGFVVCAGIGVLILSEVIKSTNAYYIIFGLGMCICGISDIVSNFFVAYSISNYEKTMAELTKVKEPPVEPEEKHDEFINNNVEVNEVNTNTEDTPLQ